MFESFSERCNKVIMLAQEEARRLGHNFVGTEQILLGLVDENDGVASKVLQSIGLNLRDARYEVEKIIGRGSGFVAVDIPLHQEQKKYWSSPYMQQNYLMIIILVLNICS